MAKTPDAFRTISEVADDLDLPQHVLRFWETRFSQIKPLKRGGGRRYYRPEDVNLLRGIRHLLYGEGYTIKGVQRIIKEQGVRHVSAVWQESDEQVMVSQTAAVSVETAPKITPDEPAAIEKTDPAEALALTSAVPEEVVASSSPPVAEVESEPETPKAVEIQSKPKLPEPMFPAEPEPVSAPPVAEEKPMPPAVVKPATPPQLSPDLPAAPPFSLLPSVPNHLINAIRGDEKQAAPVSPLVFPVGDNGEAHRLPNDILPEVESEPERASFTRGLLGKLPFSNLEEEPKKNADRELSEADAAHLQSTLFELLECKRLLDQIR